MQHIRQFLIALLLLGLATSCSDSFLDEKPQKALVVLRTLDDVEALLDNQAILNRTAFNRILSDGDLIYTDSKIKTSVEVNRNMYLWAKDIDPTDIIPLVWDMPYQQIMYANVALEALAKLKPSDGYGAELQARARFYRAWAHYNLLQDFAPAYRVGAEAQLGVPIITDSDYPKALTRASLQAVYDFIVAELLACEGALPPRASATTRPSRQAVYALLARVYLNQQDYKQALQYSDKALALGSALLDLNELSFGAGLPFAAYNYNSHPEVVFFAYSQGGLIASAGVEASDALYAEYLPGDLRRQAYFDQDRLYTGTYSGQANYNFTGLAVDELLLNRAECLVRLDRAVEGLAQLEELLQKRYEEGAIELNKAMGKTYGLALVLLERQKELVGRGTRWTDLKRLNLEPSTAVELSRSYEGQSYSLPPNDPRYVFALPLAEVQQSGLEQNKR